MILVNEDHEMYEPDVVGYIIHHALGRTDDGSPLYRNIDAVLYLTERHAAQVQGNLTFPLLSVESAHVAQAPWKAQVIAYVLQRWADWSGTPLFHSDFAAQSFTTIEDIPEIARRHEAWELAYRRNPYMRDWSIKQVRERFDEVICISHLAFIVESPHKPDDAAIASSMESMSHLMLEMGSRAIPKTDFCYSPDRLAEASRRLGLADDVAEWLARDCDRK
jgi:hypothetical protein|tara:strand:- start:192 stop:851 length:660 start_codon:yes stop_codon:yes gene_type:complete